MSFISKAEKRHALRFLTQQRNAWTREMSKYETFEFVIGIRLRTSTTRYVNVETHWCGDMSVCDDMTPQNMFGGPLDMPRPEPRVEELYTVSDEELQYPGAEEWVSADLSPTYKDVVDLGSKSRTMIKFAWWKEHKGQHGKQPYAAVGKHPELLFPWWTEEFPDIPFTNIAVGLRDHAKRIVPYIHARYVRGEHVGSETSIQIEEEPVRPDMDSLISSVPPCDPIHMFRHQPIMYDMAYYQKRHGVSRKATYTHFGFRTTEAWDAWAKDGGEDTWATIVELQIEEHTPGPSSGSNLPAPAAVAAQPAVANPPTQPPQQQPAIAHPRQSSRIRHPSSTLQDMVVVDKTTSSTIRRNTKNTAKNTAARKKRRYQ